MLVNAWNAGWVMFCNSERAPTDLERDLSAIGTLSVLASDLLAILSWLDCGLSMVVSRDADDVLGAFFAVRRQSS